MRDCLFLNIDPAVIHLYGLLCPFQDFARFELAAYDNVAFGALHAWDDVAAVERAATDAGIRPVIERLSAGWQTTLSREYRNGAELSGGEWQRLALARIMYRDADVWILDEPTSSLDPEAEAGIFAELKENLRGRIGIVISHRFSTVRIADRIAVIADGRVKEIGTHDELLRANGRYAQLFELQAAGYR